MSDLALPDTALAPTSLPRSELIMLRLDLARGPDGTLALPAGDAVPVRAPDGAVLRLELGPIRPLFRGDRDPGEFVSAPPPEYDPVFALLEINLAAIQQRLGKPLRDDDALKLFSEMRRRPDGKFQSPLYVYFRAALRLLLLARPTSEREYDAVLRRLERSARTFRTDGASTWYQDKVLVDLLGRL